VEGIEPGSDLVLPFTFQGQMSQFVVKAADVPERGPGAAKPGAKGKPTAPRAAASFMVKVLADEVNVRAQKASLTLLTVGPASRVAMHRHPRSAKLLYLLKGHARLLGPSGTPPEKLDEGSVMFLPAGYPHAIENMGRQQSAVFLQVFSQPGPERVYRNPTDPESRADFEVIRDPSKVKVQVGDVPGSRPVVSVLARAEALPVVFPNGGGKATVRILLDQEKTGNPAFGVSVVEFAPGAAAPRHTHPGAEEFLYVLSGGGTLTVGSEDMPFGPEHAIYIPSDQPHAGKFALTEPTIAVQIYAPAGPEQRFKKTDGQKGAANPK
jgi:quercetin dioxygenase-like cupin family protein